MPGVERGQSSEQGEGVYLYIVQSLCTSVYLGLVDVIHLGIEFRGVDVLHLRVASGWGGPQAFLVERAGSSGRDGLVHPVHDDRRIASRVYVVVAVWREKKCRCQ